MVRNKLHWDANDAVGLSKQRQVTLDCYEFLCFGSPTASFASQGNLFRTMWPDPAKGLLKCYLNPWITHWALALVKGNREPHEAKKNLLTSVGIEPTPSGLDLPTLCRLSYKVAQRKSGTIPTTVDHVANSTRTSRSIEKRWRREKLPFNRRRFFSFPEVWRENFTGIRAMEISFLVPFIIAFGLPYFAKISVICLLRLWSTILDSIWNGTIIPHPPPPSKAMMKARRSKKTRHFGIIEMELRTRCCRHIFPRLPARATFVADTNSGHKNVPDFVSATNVSQFAQLKKHHEQHCPQQYVLVYQYLKAIP